MKIVHFSHFGMRVSGLYESTKDQIKYERRAGHRSEILDVYDDECKEKKKDDWLSPIHWKEAINADVWVMHSTWCPKLESYKKTKVKIAVLHGPTENAVMKDWAKMSSSLDAHIQILRDSDATVVLDTHEVDVLKHYDTHGRLHHIQNSIDLERFKDVIPWEYDFHPAIGSFDTPRFEKLPLHIIWAMPFVREKIPDARLNLFAMTLDSFPQWRSVLIGSHKRILSESCESIQLANRNLRPFQAGVDIGFNNNVSGIASRVTMEMMACGVPVVSYNGDYTPYHATALDMRSIAAQIIRCWKDLNNPKKDVRGDTLRYAKEHFDREKQVKLYIALYEELLVKK